MQHHILKEVNMTNSDIQMLKDCIMFVIENDTDVDEQDVKNLWDLNMKLSLKEVNSNVS
tara:strand:- start:564 stop:740 length:177 start_codon:yes stop_codon:yes gene_type:complete